MFNFQGRDMRGTSARVSRQGLSPDIGGQELPPGAGRGVRHGRLHRPQGRRLRQIRQQRWQLQDGPEATVSKQWKKEQVWGILTPLSRHEWIFSSPEACRA